MFSTLCAGVMVSADAIWNLTKSLKPSDCKQDSVDCGSVHMHILMHVCSLADADNRTEEEGWPTSVLTQGCLGIVW